MPESSVTRRFLVGMLPGYPVEIGRWLWALDDVRRRLKRDVQDLDAAVLDWLSPAGRNSIGTLLYHIAITEIDWLYDVCQEARSEELSTLLPLPFHTEEGRLTPVAEISLREHVDRLGRTRAHLLEFFRDMSMDSFRQPVVQSGYEVTPEWVLYHLVEHESFHYGQILHLKTSRVAGQGTS